MIVDGLGFNDVRYNPERTAFEALVYIQEGEDMFAYPVHLMAPLNAEFSVICEGLTEKAIRAHRHAPARDLRLSRRPVALGKPLHSNPSEIAPPVLRRPGAALAA